MLLTRSRQARKRYQLAPIFAMVQEPIGARPYSKCMDHEPLIPNSIVFKLPQLVTCICMFYCPSLRLIVAHAITGNAGEVNIGEIRDAGSSRL